MYFFDLDGTLLDSNGVWLDIDISFLGRFGISPVPPDYTDFVTHNNFGVSAHYTKEKFDLPLSVQEIVTCWQDMARGHYANRLPLKPGAMELLETIHCKGEPLSIVTSCMPHLCAAALERHGISGLFRSVHYSHLINIEKSDPELFRQVAKLEGLRPDECILFDDSPDYCAAAKQAGWQVFGVYDPLFDYRSQELRSLCGEGHYLQDLSSYIPFL
ncbi:MAG: HAD-IA family hydrolase [Oscillospiraceae bacterium]|nr:HAD-IA family hydrolase [Oscillospiraceae bacterium]